MKNTEMHERMSVCQKIWGCFKKISVEPTMFLYMLAFMITSVAEQSFFSYKACTVDHGYSEELCSLQNYSHNDALKKEVQSTVTRFLQWNDVAAHLVPIILALFMGNWGDRRGRKIPMIMGLTGKFIYSSMIVVNALQPTWNITMISLTATLPSALLGADVAIFAACFAYISDISTTEQRTTRITILDATYLLAMPIGYSIGKYLFKEVVNESYALMFTINAALLFLAILYSILRLERRTTVHQKPFNGVNFFADFFDKKHLVMTFKTMTKSRNGFQRLHIWLLLFSMMFYVFQRDETSMVYLYTQLVFNWLPADYSNWKIVKSCLLFLAMICGVPIMSRYFKLEDTTIILIGAASHAAGRLVYALAKIPDLFFVGAVVAALGPTIPPVIRSMMSKIAPPEERGKVFSLLSVCDNAVPIFSSFLYSQLYNATIHTLPSSIFYLTFASQVFVAVLVLTIELTTRLFLSRNNDINTNSLIDS